MNNIHPTMLPFLWFAPARASGNHLSASNDEPEPDLTPEDVDAEVKRLEADMADLHDPWKGRRRREDAAGMRELDALRREGKL